MRFLKVFVFSLIITIFLLSSNGFSGVMMFQSDSNGHVPTKEEADAQAKAYESYLESKYKNKALEEAYGGEMGLERAFNDALNGRSTPAAIKIMRAFTSINDGCWFCGIHKTLLEAINDFSYQLTNPSTGPLARYAVLFLSLGLAFYIMFKVLQAFISFGEIEPKKFLSELFKPFIATILAGIIIWNLPNFYERVVSPLTELAIGFGSKVYETSGVRYSRITYYGGTTGQDVNQTPGCSGIDSITYNGIGLTNEVHKSIQCFLRQVSSSLIVYMAAGASFIANCWRDRWFPNWTMLGVGLCIFIGCFSIFISFPLRLLDAIIRLMFVCALMPLWVVLWVLPATREKSVAAFNMFLGALVTFVCMSIIMLMVLQVFDSILGLTPDQQTRFFNEYLLQGKTDEALRMMDWGQASFFACLAMTFLALALTKKAESFANQFAQASSLGVGANLEKWALAGAMLPVNKVARPLAKKGIDKTGKLIGKGVKKWKDSRASSQNRYTGGSGSDGTDAGDTGGGT